MNFWNCAPRKIPENRPWSGCKLRTATHAAYSLVGVFLWWTQVSCGKKTAEMIEMPFVGQTPVGPWNRVKLCCSIPETEMTMGQWVTGQQIWVGHVSHGSILVTRRWPMIKLTRLQEQAILWQWWCLIFLRALPLSGPDWKLQQSGVMTRE